MEGSRLEAFEKMFAAVQKEHADILSKMEKMKADGKVKTVTYQQLMSRKMMYQNMLSLYEIYGLTEKNDYIQYLSELIPDKDSLKIVKTEAKKYYKEHTAEECSRIYPELYRSDNFQIQEVGVFLAGYIADEYPDALTFLHDVVSRHENWKVQEILAMSFDNHCAKIGYENALPLIRDWFADENANIRRAASEGLRVWTSRPYFKEHPQAAIELLAGHREDESEYVRKSAGNSLRDISKKFPELVKEELDTWDLSSKKTAQVYKLAGKFLEL